MKNETQFQRTNLQSIPLQISLPDLDCLATTPNFHPKTNRNNVNEKHVRFFVDLIYLCIAKLNERICALLILTGATELIAYNYQSKQLFDFEISN